jgi:hypothetical protein
VCFPAGARVGSRTHGWVTRQKGRSGWRPAATSASLRATSANVPADVERHGLPTRSACQGTGPSSAQSTLQTPGPYREALESAAVATREAVTARQIDQLARRDVEDGRSGRGEVVQPLHPLPGDLSDHRATPTRRRGRRRCARCHPRRRASQRECANMVNNSPNAPDRGASNGSMEWAAAPAMIARASSVRNRAATRSADDSPFRPNSAVATDCCGTERKGARKFGRMPSASRTRDANIARRRSDPPRGGRGLVDAAGDRRRPALLRGDARRRRAASGE